MIIGFSAPSEAAADSSKTPYGMMISLALL